MSSYSQPYGLTAIHPRPIEVGVFLPGEDKKALISDNQQDAIKAMKKSDRQLHELYKRVKRRYIKSFKGDMDAILADASAILQAVRKKHFQDEIGTIRNLTPKEEDIIEFYNDQPEPQRSEKIQRAKDMIKAKRKAAVANYENCYNYLLLYLDAQIEALQYYGLPLSGLEELTAAKASEWYQKPKSKPKESTAHIEKAVEEAKKLFFDMPTSSASHLLLDIISAGDSIADLPERKKQVSRGAKYEVKASGNKRLVSMENYEGTAKVTVKLTNINKLTKPKVANSRLGLFRRCSMNVVNYLLSPKLLEKANKKEGRPALVNPLNYYLG